MKLLINFLLKDITSRVLALSLVILLGPIFSFGQSMHFKNTDYEGNEVTGTEVKTAVDNYLTANPTTNVPNLQLNTTSNTSYLGSDPCSWGSPAAGFIFLPSSNYANSGLDKLFVEGFTADLQSSNLANIQKKNLQSSIKLDHLYFDQSGDPITKTTPYVYKFIIKVWAFSAAPPASCDVSSAQFSETIELFLGYHPDGTYAFQDKSMKTYFNFYTIQARIIDIIDVTNEYYPDIVNSTTDAVVKGNPVGGNYVLPEPVVSTATSPAANPKSLLDEATIDQLQTNWKFSAKVSYQKVTKVLTSTTLSQSFPVYTNIQNFTLSPFHFLSAANDNKLTVAWNTFGGEVIEPALYELEWKYIDDYVVENTAGNVTVREKTTAELLFDFNEDVTRVVTKNTSYEIPLIYKRGYIAYRVRYAMPDVNNYGNTLYSPWSTLDNITVSIPPCVKLGLDPPCEDIAYLDAHESDGMNWNYQTSFAEEGKSKGVLSYFDGLLKNRQSLTRFSSSPDRLIVSEPVYNHEGGVGLQSLPIPYVQSTDLSLRYQTDFFKKNTIDYFTAADFDQLLTPSTPGTAPPTPPLVPAVDPNAKAGLYYSGLNPLLAPSAKRYLKAIPDAEGFPYIHTEYSVDDPSRVKRQGGAGYELQLGRNHETKYFYMDPEQAELNKYFGLNIGGEKFYEKAITRDPNNQLSFSVTNNLGKPVMTGLMGPPPTPGSGEEPIVALDDMPAAPANHPWQDLTNTHKPFWDGNVQKFSKKIFSETNQADLEFDLDIPEFKPCPQVVNTISKPEIEYELSIEPTTAVIQIAGTTDVDLSNSIPWFTPYSNTYNGLLPLEESVLSYQASYTKSKLKSAIDIYFTNNSISISNTGCITPLAQYQKDALDGLEDPCALSDEGNGTECSTYEDIMKGHITPGGQYAKYRVYGESKTVVGDKSSLFAIVGWKWKAPYDDNMTTAPNSQTNALLLSNTSSMPFEPIEILKLGITTSSSFYNPNIPNSPSLQQEMDVAFSEATTGITPIASVASGEFPGEPIWSDASWTATPFKSYVLTYGAQGENENEPQNIQDINEYWAKYYDLIATYVEPVYMYEKLMQTNTSVPQVWLATPNYTNSLPAANFPVDYFGENTNKLVEEFSDIHATDLLPLHPEYEHSQGLYCDEQEGQDFVRKLQKIPSYEVAKNLGMLNLTGTFSLTEKDPLYSALPSGSGGQDILERSAFTPQTSTPASYNLRLDVQAYIMVSCQAATTEQCILDELAMNYSSITDAELVTLSPDQENQYFDRLRALYLARRGYAKATASIPTSGLYREYEVNGSFKWSNGNTPTGTDDQIVIDKDDPGRVFQKEMDASGNPNTSSSTGSYDATNPAVSDYIDVVNNQTYPNPPAQDGTKEIIVSYVDDIIDRLRNCLMITPDAGNSTGKVLDEPYSNSPTYLFSPPAGSPSAYIGGNLLEANLRGDLINFMTNHAKAKPLNLKWKGGLTPEILKTILFARGIRIDDLCNPWLIDYLDEPCVNNKVLCDNKELFNSLLYSEALGSPNIDIMKELIHAHRTNSGAAVKSGNTNITLAAIENSSNPNSFDDFVYKYLDLDGTGGFIPNTNTAIVINNDWEFDYGVMSSNIFAMGGAAAGLYFPKSYICTLTNTLNSKTLILRYLFRNSTHYNSSMGVFQINFDNLYTSYNNYQNLPSIVTNKYLYDLGYHNMLTADFFQKNNWQYPNQTSWVHNGNPNVAPTNLSPNSNQTSDYPGAFHTTGCYDFGSTTNQINFWGSYTNSMESHTLPGSAAGPQGADYRSFYYCDIQILGNNVLSYLEDDCNETECITAAEMKSQYQGFKDEVLANLPTAATNPGNGVEIKGPRHPFYNQAVKSYFNYQFRKKHPALKYTKFMEGCNLTDYEYIPAYYDYIRAEGTAANMKDFLTNVKAIELEPATATDDAITVGDFEYLWFEEGASGNTDKMSINCQNILPDTKYYRDFIADVESLATSNSVILHKNKLEGQIGSNDMTVDILIPDVHSLSPTLSSGSNFPTVSPSSTTVKLKMLTNPTGSPVSYTIDEYQYKKYNYIFNTTATSTEHGLAINIAELNQAAEDLSIPAVQSDPSLSVPYIIKQSHLSHRTKLDNQDLNKLAYLSYAYNSTATLDHESQINALKRQTIDGSVYPLLTGTIGELNLDLLSGDYISYLNPLAAVSSGANNDEHVSGTLYLAEEPTITDGLNFLDHCLTSFAYNQVNAIAGAPNPFGASPNLNCYSSYPSSYTSPSNFYRSSAYIGNNIFSFSGPTTTSGPYNSSQTYNMIPKRMDGNVFWYKVWINGATAIDPPTYYNIYIKVPEYLTLTDLHEYTMDLGTLKVLRTEENGSKAFSVVFNNIGPAGGTAPSANGICNAAHSFTAIGRTNFVLDNSNPVEFDYVMLCDGDGSVELFNPCFDDQIDEAKKIAHTRYLIDVEKKKGEILNEYITHIKDTLTPTIKLRQPKMKYAMTLYGYDRAGNLSYTVPPTGVRDLTLTATGTGTTKTVNEIINEKRADDANPTYGISLHPTHIKKTEYQYNSLNQLNYQKTPDGGETTFYYDPSGKLCFSQNANQSDAPKKYSYTLYDNQNRIIETGQVNASQHVEDLVEALRNFSFNELATINGQSVGMLDDCNSVIRHWIYYMYRTEVVRTFYDEPIYTFADATQAGFNGMDEQTNLRSRVAAITYHEKVFNSHTKQNLGTDNLKNGIHYSYDLSGNVKTLTYDMPELDYLKQRYKRVDYDYDLYSGKVNLVSYNRGFMDQFYQRYEYDADNRITSVETSPDGLIWDNDAEYEYYPHGPLARINLGDNRVQGVDFAYTLQGWLKSINGDAQNPNNDIGADGLVYNQTANPVYPPSLPSNLEDKIQSVLYYYQNDYTPIDNSDHDGNSSNSMLTVPDLPTIRSLYNGNISAQLNAQGDFEPLYKKYWYDQLNRIKDTKYKVPTYNYGTGVAVLNNFSAVASTANIVTGLSTAATPDDIFRSQYSYDLDGNLTNLKRNAIHLPSASSASVFDIAGTNTGDPMQVYQMDDINYGYDDINTNSDASINNNKLQNYTDSEDHFGVTTFNNDIVHHQLDPLNAAQNPNLSAWPRLRYDNIGNLIEDNTNNSVTSNLSIAWNLYGKIRQINKGSGPTGIVETFAYEPGGNRFMKSIVKQNVANNSNTDHINEYYIRDASGNILAIYKQKQELSYSAPFVTLADELYNNLTTGFGASIDALTSENGEFKMSLINNLFLNQTDFVNNKITSHGASFYIDNNVLIKNILVRSQPNLIENLLLTNQAQIEGIVNQNFSSNLLEPLWYMKPIEGEEPNENNAETYIPKLVELDNIEQMNSLLSTIGSRTIVTDMGGFVNAFISHQAGSDMSQMLDNLSLYYTRFPNQWTITANSLLESAAYRTNYYDRYAFGTVDNFLVGELNASYNQMLGTYFDGLDNVQELLGRVEPSQRLNVVYDSDPSTFLNEVMALTNGSDLIGGALSKMYRNNITSLLVDMDHSAGSSVATLSMVSVLEKEKFYLAEHHLYGSSRLGVKHYWPGYHQFSWTKPLGATNATQDLLLSVDNNQFLSQPRPWFSEGMNSLIEAGHTNPWQNENTGPVISNRVIGQKHYELTNHLGNVMTVVTDKVEDKAVDATSGLDIDITNSVANIVYKNKPSIYSAYDYYPFGMLMPHRYLENTDVQCTPITTTIYTTGYVPVWANSVRMADDIGSVFVLGPGSGGSIQPSENSLIVLPDEEEPGANVSLIASMPGTVVGGNNHQVIMNMSNLSNRSSVNIQLQQFINAEEWVTIAENEQFGEGDVIINGTPEDNQPLRVVLSGVGANFGLHSMKMRRIDRLSKDTTMLYCSSDEDFDSDYRFGFNGQEKDNEIAGIGNSNTATFWQYDTRLGRRWNRDPKRNISISDYAVFANNPIRYSDPKGDTIFIKGDATFTANTQNFLQQIAATDKGAQMIRQLENSTENLVITEAMTIKGNIYKNWTDAHTLKYDDNPWRKDVDGGSLNGMLSLGHELYHAYQHIILKTMNNKRLNTYPTLVGYERGAVSFANYLRSVYDLGDFRMKYSGRGIGGTEEHFLSGVRSFNPHGEKITNFEYNYEATSLGGLNGNKGNLVDMRSDNAQVSTPGVGLHYVNYKKKSKFRNLSTVKRNVDEFRTK